MASGSNPVRRRAGRLFARLARSRGYAKVEPASEFRKLARERGYAKVDPPRAFRRLAESRGYAKVDPPRAFRRLAESRGFAKVEPAYRFRTLAESRGFAKVKPAKVFKQLAEERGFQRVPTIEEVLRAQRFTVDEVIDVGVHDGTPELYAAFAESRFVLVEPIPDGESMLRSKPADYTYVSCGLGAQPGHLTFRRYNNEKLNSFLELRDFGVPAQIAERRQLKESIEVPVRTLDQIIDEHCATDRIGVKIDTEGFELEVLKGLDAHRDRVAFIMAEVSVVKRHEDAPTFSDVDALLHAKGFRFLTMLNPLKKVTTFYDAIFVHAGDPRLELPVWRIEDLEERDRAAALARTGRAGG